MGNNSSQNNILEVSDGIFRGNIYFKIIKNY